MSRRVRFILLGAVLGALGWWVLTDRTAPSVDPAQIQQVVRSKAPQDARADRGRRPLPTRTEADSPALTSSDRPKQTPRESHGRTQARCQLSETLSAQSGAVYLVRQGRHHLLGAATVEGGEVRFPAGPSLEKVTLHLSGFDPVPVVLTTQGDLLSCEPAIVELTPRGEMTLTGHVRNTAGNPEPDARIRGCGPARVQDDGTFTVKPARAPCSLSAVRQDGFWFSRSERHEVPWIEGGAYEVELTLNEYPRGGMGIGIRAQDDGIVVEDVHAGSPAAHAGLQEGDLIITLEGEPTAGMPVSQFVADATGEAGSDVTVVVVNSDGDERTITLTREVLGP